MRKIFFFIVAVMATLSMAAKNNVAVINEQELNENLTEVEDYFRQDIYASSDEVTMLKSSDFCIVSVVRNGVPQRVYFNFLKKDGKLLHLLINPHADYTREIETAAGIYCLSISVHGVTLSRQNLDLSIGQYGGISIKGDKVSCEKL